MPRCLLWVTSGLSEGNEQMDLTAYLRFSPTSNGEHSNSIELQREVIDAWSARFGHNIVKYCADDGISGGEDLDVRVALGVALESVKTGLSDGIVVKCLDRWARDLVIQETCIKRVARLGGVVFSTVDAEQQNMGDDPDQEFMRIVQGGLAQRERKIIVRRMSAGRKLAASQGKFAYGAPPYGQAVAPHDSGKGSKLVEVPAEQLVIQRITALRDSGLSIRAVAAALNAEGHKTRHGGDWASSTVAKVLDRTT